MAELCYGSSEAGRPVITTFLRTVATFLKSKYFTRSGEISLQAVDSQRFMTKQMT
jgi:hypothetical protein